MPYILKYYFEEDADRIDGLLVEELIRKYEDCKIKKFHSDVKLEYEGYDVDSPLSFCEIEIECNCIETFDMLQDHIEMKFRIVPYKIDYQP